MENYFVICRSIGSAWGEDAIFKHGWSELVPPPVAMPNGANNKKHGTESDSSDNGNWLQSMPALGSPLQSVQPGVSFGFIRRRADAGMRQKLA